MKKLLLFGLIIGFALSSFAQNHYQVKEMQKRILDEVSTHVSTTHNPKVVNMDKSLSEEVNRVYIGKALNQRAIRREETHTISYNPELDVISITMVANPDDYDNIDDAGTIAQFYSTDKGQTWNGPIIVAENNGNVANYYVSGTLFNPPGNTDILESYAISQSTNLDWNTAVFGKNKLSGDNQATEYIIDDNNNYNGYFNQFGVNQYGNEIRCLNIYVEGEWPVSGSGGFTEKQLQPITGVFNDGDFEWQVEDEIDLELAVDADGIVKWAGMFIGNDAGTDMLWSIDGQIGYMFMVSVTEDENTGMQPIIVKTTDGGDSWDYIELDFQSDEAQGVLYEHLSDATEGIVIPYFNESAGVVDANGDLQLLCAVGSHSADVITYPDSIGWAYQYPGDLFALTVDDNGIKELMWVDSLNTDNVTAENGEAYADGRGWQHRLSAARSDDETELFYTWTDTRDAANNDYNSHPDVFGWSRNIETSVMSEVTCLTEGSLYETFFFFTYGADRVFYDAGTKTFTIPYMNGVSPGDFSTNTSGVDDPISYDYITGIEFQELPVGTQELDAVKNIKVTQNNPNPFNGTTTINVTTETVAPVMVEVSNIMGQTIYTVNAGNVNGTQEITLTSNDMEAGVYFYTVTVGNERITKKMVVK